MKAMSFHSILFFLFLIYVVAAETRFSNISLGSSLTPTTNSSWPSPSGIYAFGFFRQHVNGYAVGVFLSDKTVVWTVNRDNNPTLPSEVVSMQLTYDGRLILRRKQGQDIDVINPSQPIASASMLDNGNFVLYDSNSSIIWQSFDHPTNTLLPGQRLGPGEGLFSSASETDYSRGIFMLIMQRDGNLVQYPVNAPTIPSNSYYASGTYGAGNNVSLNLDNDGRLYLLNGSVTLRNITGGGFPTQNSIYLMRLDVGGNWTRRWSSTEDACTPKGFCGPNAFCIQMDNVPECQCLPGFQFVQSENNTAGCSVSFSAQGCHKIDDRLRYEIRAVENTVWEDNPYDVLDTASEEECRQACWNDCNCEAAFFKDRQCRKQRLPLRFGRRSLSSSDMALVRVSTSTIPGTEGVSGNPNKRIKKEGRLVILIIGIVFMIFGMLAMSISAIFAYRKQRDYKKISKDGEAPNIVEDIALQAFTFEDLARATNDFKEELGRGASGTVYKGILQNSKKLVAVKKLEKEVTQGREFQTEMKTIGKTYHRNLVKLLGYCLDGANKLLVFEFMSNGSLADILFKPENRPSWEERIKIARDISRGILYLHEECETQIIHCDIKPQNILMDENWCAKISDFGMAKLLKQDQTNTYTGMRGTKGYVAPEWYLKQAITVKADVYSFGVMLLEIICCRKCVDWSLSEDEAILEDWVYNCYAAGELGNLVGEEIVDERKLARMVKIGIWCVQNEASLRPTMKKVLLMLEGTVDIPVPPCPTSFLSSI
ncbi:hypothetical protein C2S51_014474 [Perilla frutescens var. frutescens]|nr:hypothetical protein C2S51_014474 [Perilla frutescens var. frutescens]